MTSVRLGRPRARRARAAAVALGLVLAMTAGGYLAVGRHRRALQRLAADAESHGWLLDGGEVHAGLGSATLLGARLRSANGTVTAELERITVRHWPWLPPRTTVTGARAELHGDPVGWLDRVTAARPWLGRTELAAPLTIRLRHRLLGTVELLGVDRYEHDAGLGLRASRLRVAGRDLDDVRLRFERHNESFVMRLGAGGTGPRAQLAFFPNTDGTARWLLDLPHQPARTLAAIVGWSLGADHDAARVAGSIAWDIPDDRGAPVHGRVQLVLDAWPTTVPAAAPALLGGTFSLSATLVPATAGPGWLLPHVEVKQTVFTLKGEGAVEVGPPPAFSLTARGERTCRELRALLPTSDERQRVERFMTVARDGASQRASLTLRWDAQGQRWSFERGCGLPSPAADE